ncbi:insulinase family protein [Nonomuraea angiospora]|uniref:insulinase family protein n=1 Tax=Nonomuraea angiospora TaxID=46172 RepID=UPI0034215758
MTPADGWQPLNQVIRQDEPVSLWRHETGAVHLHWQRRQTTRAFGITFDTPAEDDSGVAHVLEHWIGAGSAAYPMSSALLTAAFRCRSGFLNGFTECGRTACTFTADSGQDFREILDVVLDGVYHPLLSEREFLRESCRAIDVPARKDVASRSGWTGIVFNEMLLKPETDAQWVVRLMARHLHPGGHEQYRHEGVPSALTTLTCDAGRVFHQLYYQPQRAFSFAVGPELPQTLTALDRAHRQRRASADRVRATTARTRPASLHAPGSLRDQRWVAASIALPGGWPESWRLAFEIHDHLTATWPPAKHHGLVSRPVAIGPAVVVVAATRTEEPADRTDEPAELRRLLEDSLAGWRNGRVADDPPSLLLHRLTEPYKTLPPDIAWGLALASARSAGLSPLHLLEDEEQLRDRHGSCSGNRDPSLSAEIRVDARVLDPAPHLAGAITPPSRTRREADERVWRRPRPSQDASCLPLRRVTELPMPGVPRVQRLDTTLEVLPDGPRGVYGHVLVPVTEDNAWLLRPLIRLWPSLAADHEPRLAVANPRVRMDNGRPVMDLVFSGWTPDGWHRQLERMTQLVSTQQGAERAARCVARCLDEGSWRLVTAPYELAESAAFGLVTVPGAAQDAVDGLPAMVAWRGSAAPDVFPATLSWLSTVPVRVLAVGKDVPAEARSLSRALPTGDEGEPEPPAARPVKVSRGRDRFAHAVAWPMPPELDQAVAAVLASDIRRRIAHQILREDAGAYGAHASFDSVRGGLCLSTHADPAGAARTGELLEIIERHYVPPGHDDLETARVMVARSPAYRPPARTDLAGLLEHAWSPSAAEPLTAGRLLAITADELAAAAKRCLAPNLGRAVSIN